MTVNPDIKVVERNGKEDFIVNACDGIWDCVENEECCEIMTKLIKEHNPSTNEHHKPVESLLDSILATDTSDGKGTDNMTAILIKFK